MKKYVLAGLLLFLVSNLVAQNKKLIGVWQENYHTRKDTTDTGRDEMNSHYNSYKSGYKKLSSEFIVYSYIYPGVYPDDDLSKSEISIVAEDGVFWIITEVGEKEKLIYAPKTNNYYGEFKQLWGAKGKIFVEYDPKNKKVIFIEEETEMLLFDFSRKQ